MVRVRRKCGLLTMSTEPRSKTQGKTILPTNHSTATMSIRVQNPDVNAREILAEDFYCSHVLRQSLSTAPHFSTDGDACDDQESQGGRRSRFCILGDFAIIQAPDQLHTPLAHAGQRALYRLRGETNGSARGNQRIVAVMRNLDTHRFACPASSGHP